MSGSDAVTESAATIPAIPAPPVVSIESWTYDDVPGVLVTLPNHRLRSTRIDDLTLRELPLLLDYSVERYRRPLGDSILEASRETQLVLPAIDPARPLEVYLFADRAQWRMLTRSLLGAQAGPYLRIGRGGYSWGGRAVLIDLANNDLPPPERDRDTLTIAAHEGWHQFTQRTFEQPLPSWLEEGLATVMEGIVELPAWRDHTGQSAGRNARRTASWTWPPANAQRLSDLAAIARSGRLLPLADLLTTAPAELLAQPGRANEPAAESKVVPNVVPVQPPGDLLGGAPNGSAGSTEIDRYYAQVWALSCWLMADESELTDGPSHRAALGKLILDASGRDGATGAGRGGGTGGRVGLHVAEALGSDRARGLALVHGPAVFLAYFGHDLDAHDRHYRAFVARLAQAPAR